MIDSLKQLSMILPFYFNWEIPSSFLPIAIKFILLSAPWWHIHPQILYLISTVTPLERPSMISLAQMGSPSYWPVDLIYLFQSTHQNLWLFELFMIDQLTIYRFMFPLGIYFVFIVITVIPAVHNDYLVTSQLYSTLYYLFCRKYWENSSILI